MLTKSANRGCWVALVAWCGLAPSLLAGELARPADSFVDSMGVNTHSSLPGNSYDQDWNRAIQAVGQIGFRYVRDLADRPDRLNALSAATGAKIDAIAQNGATPGNVMNPASYPTVLNRLRSINNLAYIEWPNEPEYTGYTNWQDPLRAWVIPLYSDVKADPVLKTKPVITTVSWQASTISDLLPYSDLGNVHCYPGGLVPSTNINPWMVLSQPISGNKPRISTETGYVTMPSYSATSNNFGVSEAAAGKYLPRTYFDFFNAGFVKTLAYELMDERPEDTPTSAENHFGLLRTDFSFKPAATAIKNMIALLADPGNDFGPSSLDYTLTGGGSTLRHTLLQKRDGTFWLALWQDASVFDNLTQSDIAVSDVPVTLTLGSQAAVARTYLPGQSDSSLASYVDANQLNLQVPAEVMLVQIDFTGVTLPEPGTIALLLLVPLLGRRRRH